MARHAISHIRRHVSIHTNWRLTGGNIRAEIAIMTRAITDKRLRRVWAILIGSTALAVTVVMVTIAIHDYIH